MNDATAGYSIFSSAWFALMYSDGRFRERLASALMRVSKQEIEGLSPIQERVLQRIFPQRIRQLDSRQLQELVDSLDEPKLHQLAEAVAQLYLMTVDPNNAPIRNRSGDG